jgi:transposase
VAWHVDKWGQVTVRSITDSAGIFLCRELVDGRKQFNSLAAIVELELGRTPFDGSLYLFLSRGRNLLKILYYDVTGFALWAKRLEKGRFHWPTGISADSSFRLQPDQVALLLKGCNIELLKPHQPIKRSRCL